MLDGKDLRIVVTIAEHGSLVKAGRVLGMSQPSLTRSLAQVEEKLGATLFDRSRRGMAPTMPGAPSWRMGMTSWRGSTPWPPWWRPCAAPSCRH